MPSGLLEPNRQNQMTANLPHATRSMQAFSGQKARQNEKFWEVSKVSENCQGWSSSAKIVGLNVGGLVGRQALLPQKQRQFHLNRSEPAKPPFRNMAISFESKRAGQATFPKHVKNLTQRPRKHEQASGRGTRQCIIGFALITIFLNFDFPSRIHFVEAQNTTSCCARTSTFHNEAFQRHRSSGAGAGRRIDVGCRNACCWSSARHMRGLPSGRGDYFTSDERMPHDRKRHLLIERQLGVRYRPD